MSRAFANSLSAVERRANADARGRVANCSDPREVRLRLVPFAVRHRHGNQIGPGRDSWRDQFSNFHHICICMNNSPWKCGRLLDVHLDRLRRHSGRHGHVLESERLEPVGIRAARRCCGDEVAKLRLLASRRRDAHGEDGNLLGVGGRLSHRSDLWLLLLLAVFSQMTGLVAQEAFPVLDCHNFLSAFRRPVSFSVAVDTDEVGSTPRRRLPTTGNASRQSSRRKSRRLLSATSLTSCRRSEPALIHNR